MLCGVLSNFADAEAEAEAEECSLLSEWVVRNVPCTSFPSASSSVMILSSVLPVTFLPQLCVEG